MIAEYAVTDDIVSWMALVRSVSWNFPGLETEEKEYDPNYLLLTSEWFGFTFYIGD